MWVHRFTGIKIATRSVCDGHVAPFVPFADHALYLAQMAAGYEPVIQLLWQYRRPVNLDRLRQFRSCLEHGALARLIKPAVLPFGRPRWRDAPRSDADLNVGCEPVPPGDLHAWADRQIQRPLDPARGPGWHNRPSP